jgi:predicted dehydrogenase
VGAALNRSSRPRIGLLGVGWIGRNRMQALRHAGVAEIVAIADSSDAMAAAARGDAPEARVVDSLGALLAEGLDGVAIATPSALHAAQATRALAAGAAVFCQKPLGRAGAEVRAVVAAAQAADRLLAVDLSYRFTRGMQAVRDLVRSGALGRVRGVDLVFHNAYGPDKPWFYDRALSGGGCVIDLGVHLVDLCLWLLGFPPVSGVSARLFAGGARLHAGSEAVEDYATACFEAGDAAVSLACSWKLHLGQDAVISVAAHGTEGGALFRNIDGSFYDFVAEHCVGTTRRVLAEPPDDWGGGAIVDWAQRLAAGAGYDAAAGAELVAVASVLDRIYAAA